jgi:hypothetical protein
LIGFEEFFFAHILASFVLLCEINFCDHANRIKFSFSLFIFFLNRGIIKIQTAKKVAGVGWNIYKKFIGKPPT